MKKRKQRASLKIDEIVSIRKKNREEQRKSRHLKCNTPEGLDHHLAQQRKHHEHRASKTKVASEAAAADRVSRLKHIAVSSKDQSFFAPSTSSTKEGSLVMSKASVEKTGASVASLSVHPPSPVKHTKPSTVSTSVHPPPTTVTSPADNSSPESSKAPVEQTGMSAATRVATLPALVTPSKRSTPAKRKCAIDFNDLPKEVLQDPYFLCRIRGCSDVNCQVIHPESGSVTFPAGREESDRGTDEHGTGQGLVWQAQVYGAVGGNQVGGVADSEDETGAATDSGADEDGTGQGDAADEQQGQHQVGQQGGGNHQGEGDPPPPPPPPPRVSYCQNCMREELGEDPEYEWLGLRSVHRDYLRKTPSKLCHVDLDGDERYNLCECCYQFLFKHTDPDKKSRPQAGKILTLLSSGVFLQAKTSLQVGPFKVFTDRRTFGDGSLTS